MHQIRYEDLLMKPEQEIKKLWNFIGVGDDDVLLETISSSIDGSRAFAYRNNHELSDFAATKKEILEGFGYSI